MLLNDSFVKMPEIHNRIQLLQHWIDAPIINGTKKIYCHTPIHSTYFTTNGTVIICENKEIITVNRDGLLRSFRCFETIATTMMNDIVYRHGRDPFSPVNYILQHIDVDKITELAYLGSIRYPALAVCRVSPGKYMIRLINFNQIRCYDYCPGYKVQWEETTREIKVDVGDYIVEVDGHLVKMITANGIGRIWSLGDLWFVNTYQLTSCRYQIKPQFGCRLISQSDFLMIVKVPSNPFGFVCIALKWNRRVFSHVAKDFQQKVLAIYICLNLLPGEIIDDIINRIFTAETYQPAIWFLQPGQATYFCSWGVSINLMII